MIRNILLRSIRKYGGDEELTDRLLLHGNKQYLTWITRSLADENDVYGSLYTLAEDLDLPISKLRYAYFSAMSYSLGELRRFPEYLYVMETMNDIFPSPELWWAMQKYCYRQFKRLCIEALVARDETAMTIMSKINVSHGLVYKVRSAYIKRELKKKENYDT